jgi:hypothetical protein
MGVLKRTVGFIFHQKLPKITKKEKKWRRIVLLVEAKSIHGNFWAYPSSRLFQ